MVTKMLNTPPKVARSGPNATSLSETTLSDAVGRFQPVEKVGIGRLRPRIGLQKLQKAPNMVCLGADLGPKGKE